MRAFHYTETAALPDQLVATAPITVGTWNGQLAYLDEAGRPLMLVDDIQNALC